jgi:hypothetical protein
LDKLLTTAIQSDDERAKTVRKNFLAFLEKASPKIWRQLEAQDPSGQLSEASLKEVIAKLSR